MSDKRRDEEKSEKEATSSNWQSAKKYNKHEGGQKHYWNADDNRNVAQGNDARRGGARGNWSNDRRDNRNDNEWNDRRFIPNKRSDNPLADLQYEIPESITAEMLDSSTRQHLRNLNRENSEVVARHLAYAGEMMDLDPEVAYKHAKAAFARAARIDVVREALGLTAYVTARYAQALSELRTYRRMSNDYSHVAIEADAERGLGRPEKALRFIEGIPLDKLDDKAKIELVLVTSGARAAVGDSAGGLAVLEKILIENLDMQLAARVQLVKADRLDELERTDEATELRTQWQEKLNPVDPNEALLFDLDDVFDDLPAEDDEYVAPDAENEDFDLSLTDADLDDIEIVDIDDDLFAEDLDDSLEEITETDFAELFADDLPEEKLGQDPMESTGESE